MKLLFASDSFKGSLSSEQTVRLLAKAAGEIFGEIEYSGVPVADGGEGTVDAVVAAEHGEYITVEVYGPLMERTTARYGKLDDQRAVIEMAAASGLPMVPRNLRNPLHTSTYGTGEMIRDALDKGFRDISIAIGGSATNDGGMGCARALGVRFLDAQGNELQGTGSDLEKVAEIDVSGLDPRISETKITVMCDVTNPLTGKDGATYTFGAQKGATPEIQARLEAGMINYRDVIMRQFGINADEIRGGGAAGGLGTALMVFLHGEMKSGIDTVLDLINFDKRLEGVDLVVTGEGRTDWQSCFGKVMQGVGERSAKQGIVAVGLSGSLGRDAAQIYSHGIESLITSVDSPMQIEEAISRAEELYYLAAIRMFRFIRAGMKIAQKQ
ncbi:MAG TPA: glycerate kinase [Erysipelotrichaceae bacterium]|nr:glycerate kinase [Erysipelotrichaceae bacterium]